MKLIPRGLCSRHAKHGLLYKYNSSKNMTIFDYLLSLKFLYNHLNIKIFTFSLDHIIEKETCI